MQLLGHVPDRRGPTAPPHVEGEALGVERIVGQEGEPFLLHLATAPTGHAPDFDLEVDPHVAAGEISDAALLAVVPAALPPAAGPAGRFFDRRVSVMMRAWGTPKIPVTVELGRNPGKRYASHSRRGRRGVGMRRSCPIPASPPQRFRPRARAAFRTLSPFFSPTHFHEEPLLDAGSPTMRRRRARPCDRSAVARPVALDSTCHRLL